MPKVTIEFDLDNNPEDPFAYSSFNHSRQMYSFIYDFKDWLRSELKYREGKASIEDAQKIFFELLRDNSLEGYID